MKYMASLLLPLFSTGCFLLHDVESANLVGEYCIPTNPIVHAWNKLDLTLERARALQTQIRHRESVSVTIQADGTMHVGDNAATIEVLLGFDSGWVVDVKKSDGKVFANGRAKWIFDEDGDLLIDPFDETADWFYLSRNKQVCMRGLAPKKRKAKAASPPKTQTPAERFMALPHEQWPQLVLTNSGGFTDERELHGASAFLARVHGRTLAVAADHLLGPAGGVEPRVQLSSFKKEFLGWVMYPRTDAKNFVRIAGLAMDPPDKGVDFDGLALELDAKTKALPSYPLRLRETPVALGERVFLVGCEYVDRDCKQKVYSAIVSGRRGDSAAFRYDLDKPVRIRGFSGAPILDANGHVVGTMANSFQCIDVGDTSIEAGGFDASQLLTLIRKVRRDSTKTP